MGTPAYMPPEQALGEIDQLDERADVFGLGAILAEILTVQPPYVADDGTQVFRMASRGKLTDCFKRLDACGADEDLVAFTKHCLSPDPVDRPRDAGVLAARITAHLASVETRLRIAEVERAAEAARATKALRTVAETKARARAEQRTRRLQLSVAVVGLVAVSLGGAAAFSSAVYQRQLKDEALAAQRKADTLRIEAENASLREQKLAAEARDAQRREAEMRSLAEEREQVTQATLYASEMNLAAQAAEVPSGLRRVGEITSAWKPDRVVRDLRGWEWYYLESLRHAARESLPSHHAIGLRWSPDGKRYATFGRDHRVRVWDKDSAEMLFESVGHTGYVYEVAWNPAGTQLASAGRDFVVRFWDAKDGQPLGAPIEFGEHVYAVRWSPDGTRLATSVIGRTCVLLESDGRVQLVLPSLDHDILSMMWSPTGDEIAFGLRDSTIRVWNARAGRFAAMLRGHDGPVGDVAWNHDGTLLASTSPESIKLWDWPPRSNPAVLNAERPQLFNLAWSDDGRSIFGGSDFVESWDRDTLTRQSLVTIGGGGQSVGWSPSVSWSQSARSIAARREGKLVLLDDQTGELRRELPHDVEFMRSLALNADGTRLATSSYRPQSGEQPEHGEICLYDTATGGLVWKVLLHGDRAGGLAWSPDGRKLACSGWTSVEILDAADGRSLGFNAGTYEMAWVHDMCWSPDGEQLALGHLNHIIRVIDVGSGRDLLKRVGHTGPVKALSWSPDGQRIASGGDDKTVRIWNARSGLQVLVLNKHASTVETVAWSPDGKQLASGSITGELLIWDARMGPTFDTFAASPAEPGGGLNPVQTPQDAERELARLTAQLAAAPMDAELWNARGMLLARLGRWAESADSYSRLTKLNPDRRYGWAVAATPLLMAGDADRYRQHCRAMVEHFKGVSSAEIADTVCKTALLLPDVVPLAELPASALRDGITDPKWQAFRQWFLACGALISYREGQPAEAIRWTTQMADFRSQPGALALVVRAMSEHQLEQPAAARESLKAAELQIPLQLRTLGTEGDATSLPVALGVADHDWIVPEILRREAEQLMRMKQ